MTTLPTDYDGHVMRTPDEWCRIKQIQILDADGWRGRDGKDWREPLTELDFEERAQVCTQRSVALPTDLTTTDSIRCYRDDHALYREVLEARRKAHAKHGFNSIEVEPANSPRWLAILVEEIGETANALTYDGPTGNLRAELIDVLAVASAWVAAIDRDAEQATK